MSLHDDVEEILLDAQAITDRVAELGAEISSDFADRDPVLVSVLKGQPEWVVAPCPES